MVHLEANTEREWREENTKKIKIKREKMVTK